MPDKFQQELSRLGYSLIIHRLQEHEIENLLLPTSYNKERTAGIICVEMFNKDYCHMLCGLDIPTLFVDTPVTVLNNPLKSDCLYMDNQSNICSFVREMIRRTSAICVPHGMCASTQHILVRMLILSLALKNGSGINFRNTLNNAIQYIL